MQLKKKKALYQSTDYSLSLRVVRAETLADSWRHAYLQQQQQQQKPQKQKSKSANQNSKIKHDKTKLKLTKKKKKENKSKYMEFVLCYVQVLQELFRPCSLYLRTELECFTPTGIFTLHCSKFIPKLSSMC